MLKKLLEWVEFVATIFVWVFGMVLAILTVVQVVPILPEQISFNLLIYLIVFLFAVTIVFIFESHRRFPRRGSRCETQCKTGGNGDVKK